MAGLVRRFHHAAVRAVRAAVCAVEFESRRPDPRDGFGQARGRRASGARRHASGPGRFRPFDYRRDRTARGGTGADDDRAAELSQFRHHDEDRRPRSGDFAFRGEIFRQRRGGNRALAIAGARCGHQDHRAAGQSARDRRLYRFRADTEWSISRQLGIECRARRGGPALCAGAFLR